MYWNDNKRTFVKQTSWEDVSEVQTRMQDCKFDSRSGVRNIVGVFELNDGLRVICHDVRMYKALKP